MAESNESKPILDKKILEAEVTKMKERFETEMRKISDEMQRFQNEMVKFFDSKKKEGNEGDECSMSQCSTNNEPIIKIEGDKQILQLKFDVSLFKADEVQVNPEDGKIIIRAKHEEDIGKGKLNTDFVQEINLPPNLDLTRIQTINKDGLLVISAVLPDDFVVQEDEQKS